MIKSQFHKSDTDHAVVTMANIGCEVMVTGVGHGTLRYVGEICGKEGIFCGIELSGPDGKHNGTFQKISYFQCPPLHGIFAPIYKVQLAESPVRELTPSQTFIKESFERLSRSALPALDLKNVFSPALPPQSMQMSISTMSNESSLMNNSFIMGDSSWLDGSMCASNTTFTLPKSRLLDDTEDFDLLTMEIPKGRTLLRHIKADYSSEDQMLSTSVTLPESRVGVENLPRIDDADEGDVTPLVEQRPLNGYNIYNYRNPMMSAYHEQVHGDQMDMDDFEEREEFLNSTNPFAAEMAAVADQMDTSGDEPRPQSTNSMDTGYHGDSDGHNLSNESEKLTQSPTCISKSPSEATTPSTGAKPFPSTPRMTAAVQRRMDAAAKLKEKSTKPPKEKKASIRELQLAPVQPKFPAKPKVPSKHQIMMEQLKASIEAEKNKPKKEAKQRLSLLPPQPAPPKVLNRGDENADTTETPSKMAAVPASRKKEPLKTVNTPSAPPLKQREPRKPRQSLLPPPLPKSVPKKEETSAPTKITSTPSASVISKRANSASSIHSNPAMAKSSLPPSAFGRTVNRTGVKRLDAKKEIDNVDKLIRLQNSVRAFEVMKILRDVSEKEADLLLEKLQTSADESVHKEQQIESLRGKLSQMDFEYRSKVEETQRNMEQLTRAHDQNLHSVKKAYEKQLDEKTNECEHSLEEEKARHESEIANLTRRHQAVCAQLDEKILEAEQSAELLKKDKLALQNTLSKDNDSKIQMLSAEISSLQTALTLKSQEMKELRQHNQALTMQVEEIPSLTLEITKLKHKIVELKRMLDQKRNVEKALVSHNEELKKTAQQFSQMNQNIIQDMDVLRYQIEEKGDPMVQSTYTPTSRVTFRTRSAASNDRNSAPHSARLSASSHTEMIDRSLENSLNRSAVSMYATHRLSGVTGTDEDLIYAPDEMISSKHGFVRGRKLSFSGCEQSESLPAAQTDSGIGI